MRSVRCCATEMRIPRPFMRRSILMHYVGWPSPGQEVRCEQARKGRGRLPRTASSAGV